MTPLVYREQKILPFETRDLYNLVADVRQYPLFLPWCKGARIKSEKENEIMAELLVRFGPLTSAYTSRVLLTPFSSIRVCLEEGPFDCLDASWHFQSVDSKKTTIDFNLLFRFHSIMLQKAASLVFEDTSRKMMEAFQQRAEQLYSEK